MKELTSKRMKTSFMNDPAVERGLRRLCNRDKSDPFLRSRLICYMQNGIIDIEDVAKEGRDAN